MSARPSGRSRGRPSRGADYPASRDDLVQYAREQDADTVVIAALLEIPDEEYDSPDAVVVELVAV